MVQRTRGSTEEHKEPYVRYVPHRIFRIHIVPSWPALRIHTVPRSTKYVLLIKGLLRSRDLKNVLVKSMYGIACPSASRIFIVQPMQHLPLTQPRDKTQNSAHLRKKSAPSKNRHENHHILKQTRASATKAFNSKKTSSPTEHLPCFKTTAL
jgi:hypothetical protein